MTSVLSDAPLRNVTLNADRDFNPRPELHQRSARNTASGRTATTTTSSIWASCSRDFTEDPTLTAAPLCTEHIKMDLRCSSAPAACSSRADLLVDRRRPRRAVHDGEGRLEQEHDDMGRVRPGCRLRHRSTGGSATPSFSGDFSAFAPATGGTCTNSLQRPSARPTTSAGAPASAARILVPTADRPGLTAPEAGHAQLSAGTPPVGNLDMWVSGRSARGRLPPGSRRGTKGARRSAAAMRRLRSLRR